MLAAHCLRQRYLFVRIDPVLACNLRCRMCYFSDPDHAASKRSESLSLIDIERIGETFFRRAVQVSFGCGAEPTMVKYFADLPAIAKRFGVPQVTFVTNGQLLSESSITTMISGGLDELVVSAHGASRDTYESMMPRSSFEKLLANLWIFSSVKTARGAKTSLRINVTINAETIGEIPKIVPAFARFSPSVIQVRPMMGIGGQIKSAVTDRLSHSSIIQSKR